MSLRRPERTASTRQVVAAAVVLVVLGTLGAIQAISAGTSFMFDLEQDKPALARTQPTIVDPQTPRLARRVFLVVIDGLSYKRSYELPYLDELRRRGIDSEASSHYPSYSRPNYVSILTGVPPLASGVRTNHHSNVVLLDSLMDRAHGADLRVALATDYDVLPRLFLRPPHAGPSEEVDTDIGDGDELEPTSIHDPDANLVSPFDDARYAPWPGGFAESGAALVNRKADLVIMLVGAVDAAGHSHGGDSPQYRDAAVSADRAIARALARVDLSQDAVIITADHGHTGRGGHGGVEPEVMTVPLIMAGAGIVPGAQAKDARLIDIAPTVSALLGIPAPGHGLGRTLDELLQLPDQAPRETADQQRLVATHATVAAADARAATDVLEHRAERLALVFGGALLAIVLAVVLYRRNVLRLRLRILAITLPAFFVVYYGLIGTFGQRFSPSLLPANGQMATQLAKYGVIGAIVQVLANLWELRGVRSLSERLAAANGIAWATMMISMLFAGFMWAFFPPPYVNLPGPFMLVMIPAVEVAIACAAVQAALTLGVELIIFAARAWHRVHPAL